LVTISHKYHIRTEGGFRVKGGFQALTNEIARHFHSVRLCVPVEEGRQEKGDQYRNNIDVVPLPAFDSRKGLLRNLKRVVSTLQDEVKSADVVYCMGPNDVGVLGMAMARLEGRPMFASLDTDRAQCVLRRDHGPIIKHAKYTANKYALYPLIRRLCHDVPVFVTGDMFMGEYPTWTQWVKTTLKRRDIPPLQVSECIDSGPLHVVFAGRLAPVKNIPALLRAIQVVESPNTPVRCTVIGDGPLKKDLERLAEEMGAPVNYTGQIPNQELISSRFLDADAFVLPSLEERQGKVLLEAMACSIPVIASDAGGIPTVVQNGVNGLLCEPESAEDIADKIVSLIHDSDLRQKLIRNGHAYARQHALDVEVDRLMGMVSQHYHLEECEAEVEL
jgi:glycosyltransferase involved in cell wall biosynthesis